MSGSVKPSRQEVSQVHGRSIKPQFARKVSAKGSELRYRIWGSLRKALRSGRAGIGESRFQAAVFHANDYAVRTNVTESGLLVQKTFKK